MTFSLSLIPSGIFSEDGKRHVTSEPARLRKLHGIEQAKHEGHLNIKNTFNENDFSHLDCHFVSASFQHIRDLAGTFGNECVFYLIQDRKASVRIGRPSARGHSPFITHLDYQISTTNSTPTPPSVSYQLKPV